VVEAAVRAAAVAMELINLTTHAGEHPRLGALDVLPFVPIKGVTMEECVEIARGAGERIANELNIPVYLYEKAATRRDRVNLANVRRGEFEALRDSIKNDPDRKPDFGFQRVHPTAGAMAVGARAPLIAFNVNLRGGDVELAREIARLVRERDGGFPGVRALGLDLPSAGLVQVSMNVTDWEAAALHLIVERVVREAEARGAEVVGSELVGLMPAGAAVEAAGAVLRIDGFDPSRVLELRLLDA
jgi:glutamate formiminotransferase